MLAAQINHFEGPEVLEVVDVTRPVPGSGQLLIAVRASIINGHDAIVASVRPPAAVAAAHQAFEHDGAFGQHVLDLTPNAAV